MSERQNVQTEHKWVGQAGQLANRYPDEWLGPTGWTVLKEARLFDSPTDVPDDCTPVRVRVETWEEEGEPERITEWGREDSDEGPDGFQVVGMQTGAVKYGGQIFTNAAQAWGQLMDCYTAIPVRIPTETKRTVTLDPEPDTQPPLVLTGHHSMKTMEAIAAAREHVARAFDTDPGAWRPDLVDRDGDVIQVRFRISGEPTETGCRCLEKVDEMLDDQSRAMAVNYRRGWIDALEAVRRNLADCDCKATETP